jgi:anti-anti-sigma factor
MIDDARSHQPRPEAGQSETGQSETGQSETGAPAPPILDQAFDADSLYALRAAVAAHASQAGLPPGRADDLVIAVHELAANAVRHGAGHGRLRVWKSDQALRCEVSDDGAPQAAGRAKATGDANTADTANAAGSANATAAAKGEDESQNESKDSAGWPIEPGHGLALVSLIADKSSVSSGPSGTLATISFALGAQGAQFGLTRQHRDACTVLAVAGPLDRGTGGQLTDAIAGLLAETPDVPLVLDLSGLAGWDSAGLTALIAAQRRVGAAPGARMMLAGLPDHLNRSLRQAGLADQFTLADSAAAAAAALNRKPP